MYVMMFNEIVLYLYTNINDGKTLCMHVYILMFYVINQLKKIYISIVFLIKSDLIRSTIV